MSGNQNAFIDYAKAFDHVDHPTVMKKLAALGVPPIILYWIYSFLMDRQQRVYITDDLKSLLELHKLVDDYTLAEIIKELNTSKMQPEIDSVASWFSLNHMNINIKKTKKML